MECCQCHQTIQESAPLVVLNCTHSFHTNCFFLFIVEKNNTHEPFNCPQCQEHILPPELGPLILATDAQNEYSDDEDEQEQQEQDLLEQLWDSNPDFKVKAYALKQASIARDKAQKAFSPVHRNAITGFKTQIATTLQILKGTAKQVYTSIIQSPEYKAKQKTNLSLMRKFSALVEETNSSRWDLRRFLRRKGYNFAPFYHTRYSSYRIKRQFMLNLL
jgi:hypothetical protein